MMRYLICVVTLSLAAACAGQDNSDHVGEDEGSSGALSDEAPDTVVFPVTARGNFLGAPLAEVGLKSLSSGLDDFADDAPSAVESVRPEGATEVTP